MTRPALDRLVEAFPEITDRLRDTGCCIVFDGTRDASGYGRIYEPGVGNTQAHRYVHRRLHGDLGKLTVDHLCYVRSCLNDDHLEAVSQKENTRRAVQRRKRLAVLGEAASLACCATLAGDGAPKRTRVPSTGPSLQEQARLRQERAAARWVPSPLPVADVFEALGLSPYVVIPNAPGTVPRNRVIDLRRVREEDLPVLACEGVRDQIREPILRAATRGVAG